MARVLLLATTTGYQIRSFGEAAAALGVRLVVGSDRCDRLDDPWWDAAIPVRFHDVPGSVQAVRDAMGADPLHGILAVGDRPVVLAAHLGRTFALPGHPPEAAAVSRNKLLFRTALEAAGLPAPRFVRVPIDAPVGEVARGLGYPAVVKPLALSGSRGVMRVDTAQECAAALARLARLLRAPDVRLDRDDAHEHALIETFIPGAEYALEAVLERGRLRCLAIFDKPDPLDGPLFEETIYVTPSGAPADLQARIRDAVHVAATTIGLWHGPIHAECRVSGGTVYVLEVAARPIGGLCSRALRFGPASGRRQRGSSLEELLLRHALGEDISAYEREGAASGVMMIPIPRRGVYRRVDGIDAACAVAGVEEVQITAKPDSLLVPLPEGRSYLGFIFARGGDPRTVERALRDAHARLEFTIEREVPVAAP